MKVDSQDTSFLKFLTRRTGWTGAFIPVATPRLLRSLPSPTTPEERAERRLLEIAEKKMSVFRWRALVLGGFGLTVLSSPFLGIAPLIAFIWILGVCIGAEILTAFFRGKPKKGVPVFLENMERTDDFEETHRFILLEERLAEAGFSDEEMKRISAVMAASSVARQAGLTVTPSEEIISLFDRAQRKGLRLPSLSSRSFEFTDEGDNLLPVLRSAGVEVTRA